MQDPEKLKEIASLGETDSEPQEEWLEEPRACAGWGGALLVQAAVCILILLMLVIFKFTDEEEFQEIRQWYGAEMSQEIELPRLRGSVPVPTLAPTSDPTPSPSQALPSLSPEGGQQL